MHTEEFKLNDSILESTWIDELHKCFTSFYKEIEDAKEKILNLQENWVESVIVKKLCIVQQNS